MVKRVARDGRGERTRYEAVVVGKDLGSMEWSFTRDDVARICESDDDFHEWYSLNSPYGKAIAPLLISYPPVRMLFSRMHNIRGLFYEYTAESYFPLHADTKYTLTGKVINKWIKRDREFVQYEAACHDADGRKIFYTTRTHVLDFLTRDTPKTGEGIDSGGGGWPDNKQNEVSQ